MLLDVVLVWACVARVVCLVPSEMLGIGAVLISLKATSSPNIFSPCVNFSLFLEKSLCREQQVKSVEQSRADPIIQFNSNRLTTTTL